VRPLSLILPTVVLCLTVLGGLIPSHTANGQALDALQLEPSPWTALNQAIVLLDVALVQQMDPSRSLWLDVRETAGEGLVRIGRARKAGASDALCQAVQQTLRKLLQRQDILDPRAAMTEGDDPTQPGAMSKLADDLLFIEGRLPQTSLLLAEILFEMESDQEGQDVLARALVQWPGEARLHESVRAWRFVLPSPEELINLMTMRVDALDSSDADISGITLETIGQLHGALGVRTYEAGDYAVAGLHFDASARALHRSESMPRSLSASDIGLDRADAFVNAAMAFLGHAKGVWFEDRGEHIRPKEEERESVAIVSMFAAEQSISQAMRLRPDHDATLNAVLHIGETWKDKADVSRVNNEDLADAREFFGRMARRFDVADWWNNYAFWCRETGSTAKAELKDELATELFEQSYQAYEEAIRLDPDNARYVNDTGLMLFYHLGRDYDYAEELFLRAWELGKAVCDNPFVAESDPAYIENLSAYGDAMLNLAKLYAMRSEFVRAKQINDELLSIDPSRLDAQMNGRTIESFLPSASEATEASDTEQSSR
jgi:tetratricopeptide (TPR) repeat protein